jgi:hypothetical protein
VSPPLRDTRDGPWLWISRQSVRSICSLGKGASVTLTVYVALCDIASERRSHLFPEPRKALAMRCGVCRRMIGYALANLIRLGLVRRNHGDDQVAVFALTKKVDLAPESRGTLLPHPGHAVAPGGALSAPGGALNAPVDRSAIIRQPVTSNSEKKNKIESSKVTERESLHIGSRDKQEPLPLSGNTKICVVLEEELLGYAREQSIPARVATEFFDHFESTGWVNSRGQPITSWRARLREWWTDHPKHERRAKGREIQENIKARLFDDNPRFKGK